MSSWFLLKFWWSTWDTMLLLHTKRHNQTEFFSRKREGWWSFRTLLQVTTIQVPWLSSELQPEALVLLVYNLAVIQKVWNKALCPWVSSLTSIHKIGFMVKFKNWKSERYLSLSGGTRMNFRCINLLLALKHEFVRPTSLIYAAVWPS